MYDPISSVARLGAAVHGDDTLLAAIWGGSPTAQRWAMEMRTGHGIPRAEHFEANARGLVAAYPGLTLKRAVAYLAAIELGARAAKQRATHAAAPSLSSPEQVVLECVDLLHRQQERLRLFALNTKHQIIGQTDIYKGTLHSVEIKLNELLRWIISHASSVMIVAHNHPSGDPTPSQEDVLMTRRLYTAAKSIDIDLLDHIVVGGHGSVSLKQRGIGIG